MKKALHPFLEAGLFVNYSRRRPTLPHSYPCSTIGPEGLNFRVRDGNGCDPLGIATEKSLQLRLVDVTMIISWQLLWMDSL